MTEPAIETDDVFDIDVDVAIRSPLNGPVSGWPAVSARRKRERMAVIEAFAGLEAPSWDHYFVTVIRCASQALDQDNLRAGFKSTVDQLAAFLGLDDADPRLSFDYRQRIVRERETRFGVKPGTFKSWARVIITKTPLPAGPEDAAPAPPPDQEARRIQPASKASRPAPPEPIGGDVLRTIELPRRDGKSSRLAPSLRLLSKSSGRGGLPEGAKYIRLALFWEQRDGSPWRTQGLSVRLEEVEPLIEALRELKDAAD